MNLKKLLYGLLGYSRGERVGSLVLIMLLTLIIIFRFADIRNKEVLLSPQIKEESEISLPDTSCLSEPFEFDPNTVSFDELLELGLTAKQSNTLISYRNSGAVFNSPGDFRKVYGITKSRQDSLIPYIVIQQRKQALVAGKPEAVRKTYREEERKIEIPAERKEELFIPVELNSADSARIVLVPGIGKVLGPRIIKYRSLLGGFYKVMQLSEVYGLDSAEIQDMLPYIILDTSLIIKKDLNLAGYAELLRHPYLTEQNTRDIFNYRQYAGRISSLKDLLRNRILSKEEIAKLEKYFYVRDTAIIDR